MTTTYTRAAVSGTTTLLDSTGSSGDGGGVDLKNLANNAYVTAPAITPTAAGPELVAGYDMLCKWGTSPAAGATVFKCWFMHGQDGTNYETMDGTNTPSKAPDFIFVFPGATSTSQRRLHSLPSEVPRPAWKHKILVQNVSGQTTTNVNNDSQLIQVLVNDLAT
jgi:hypothetical protein